MPTYDRPSDLQSNTTVPGMGATGVGATYGSTGGMSPSLEEQTPGLDALSRVRDLAMRPVSWMRERPALGASIIGGLALIGIGSFLAFRSRRQSRWEMFADELQGRAEELYGWLRSKIG